MANEKTARRGYLSGLTWQKARPLTRERSVRGFGITAADLGETKASSAMLHALNEGILVPMLPKDMSARDQAIFLLRSAAEVEHALLVQYLYAYFSVNSNSAFAAIPIFPSVQPKDVLLGIAIEEMGHLMTVQNLLTSLGAPPHFDLEAEAPDPQQVALYPFPLRLEPVSPGTFGKYVTAESPEPLPAMSTQTLELVAQAKKAATEALAESGINGPIVHVGGIYAKLMRIFGGPGTTAALQEIDARMKVVHLKPGDFVGNASALQEDPTAWSDSHGSAFFVRKAETAQQAVEALQAIAEQGEGWDEREDEEPGNETHFERFLALFRVLISRPAEAALAIPVNPAIAVAGEVLPAGWTPITSPQAVPVAELFRCRYEMLVLTLTYLMTTPPGLKRDGLRGAALNGMRNGIREVGNALLRLPLTAENSHQMAGPPFRLPAALPVLPVQQKARLLELIARSEQLITDTGLFPNLHVANNQLASVLNRP